MLQGFGQNIVVQMRRKYYMGVKGGDFLPLTNCKMDQKVTET